MGVLFNPQLRLQFVQNFTCSPHVHVPMDWCPHQRCIATTFPSVPEILIHHDHDKAVPEDEWMDFSNFGYSVERLLLN